MCLYAITVGRPAGSRTQYAHAQSPRNALRVRGNFEIAKEPELISQHSKVIFKKQLYQKDQHKNWTSMICFVAYKKNYVVLPF